MMDDGGHQEGDEHEHESGEDIGSDGSQWGGHLHHGSRWGGHRHLKAGGAIADIGGGFLAA